MTNNSRLIPNSHELHTQCSTFQWCDGENVCKAERDVDGSINYTHQHNIYFADRSGYIDVMMLFSDGEVDSVEMAVNIDRFDAVDGVFAADLAGMCARAALCFEHAHTSAKAMFPHATVVAP